MIKYFSSYIVTDHELTKVCDDIRMETEQFLAGKDRLHNFLQLYEVAKTIINQLEAFDKTGFLTQVHDDLKELQGSLDEELSKKAKVLQEKINTIQDEALKIENDLVKRNECIESVLNAMQKVDDYRQDIDDIRQKMEVLELQIKQIMDIRQSAPFIEMCNQTTNES